QILLYILVYQQVLPRSVCNDPCPAGYQKKKKEGQKFCCYDCDRCSDGKMSNMSVYFFHCKIEQIVLPRSVCNDPCPAGHQKKKKEGEKFCCYDCDPCSDGKMSNMS
ncbi:Vomeronasal type-2 receptor 26, partial [Ophiophagus hannah]